MLHFQQINEFENQDEFIGVKMRLQATDNLVTVSEQAVRRSRQYVLRDGLDRAVSFIEEENPELVLSLPNEIISPYFIRTDSLPKVFAQTYHAFRFEFGGRMPIVTRYSKGPITRRTENNNIQKIVRQARLRNQTAIYKLILQPELERVRRLVPIRGNINIELLSQTANLRYLEDTVIDLNESIQREYLASLYW